MGNAANASAVDIDADHGKSVKILNPTAGQNNNIALTLKTPLTGRFSMEAEIYPYSASDPRYLFTLFSNEHCTGVLHENFGMRFLDTDNAVGVYYQDYVGTNKGPAKYGDKFKVNDWNHVRIDYNLNNRTQIVYVNGEKLHTGVVPNIALPNVNKIQFNQWGAVNAAFTIDNLKISTGTTTPVVITDVEYKDAKGVVIPNPQKAPDNTKTITYTFSDEVTGMDDANVTLKNAQGASIPFTGVYDSSAKTYTVTVTDATLVKGEYTLTFGDNVFGAN